MRLTTVAILVISSVTCCNAQRYTLAEKLRVVTDVRADQSLNSAYELDPEHRLVKLKSGVSINEAQKSGLNILTKLSQDHVIVKADDALAQNIPLFEIVNRVNFLWKLSDNIIEEDFNKNTEYIVMVEDVPSFIHEMNVLGLQAFRAGMNLIRLKGKLSTTHTLILRKQNVLYLGKESLTPTEESTVLDLYLGPNKISKVHDEFPDLKGDGIVVSIKERHYEVNDLDLRGRHIASQLAASDTSDHATDMATIVAGAGNSFITGRGVAPHAKVSSSSFYNLFPDSSGELVGINAWVQNHSYGTAIENFYGSLATAYDQQAYHNPQILHVFSSGNAGTSNATSGKYTAVNSFSNLTGNSKSAKNVLVVGAVDTTGNAVVFSSRGPTNDGRIKPDIVAYSSVGTSNSSALVAGVAALLQQAYVQDKGTYPESALIRAVLINAADDVGLPGIDFTTGFGNLNAYRSVETLRSNSYFEGIVEQNETKTFVLNIPSNAKDFKVTLVWTDLPGAVNSATPLVNNLDLQLVSSSGTTLPWILNATPNTTALTSPAVRGIDNINTVESVSLQNPTAGTYTISVKGTDLSSPNQKFAIAYQWDTNDTFTWMYPTASDNFPYNGETGTYFFWESTLTPDRGDLEVSSDNGTTWKAIAKNLLLEKGSYRWVNPSPVNVEAKARMNVGGIKYETESFTISKALNPSLGFSCSDSVMLQWNAQKNVLEYDVMKLDGNYTSSLVVQTDTVRVITKDINVSFYSVEPRLLTGKPLLRSPSINIDTYGAGCFISSFVDEAVTEQGVMLRLELGTTYGVSQVHFERMEKKNFVTIHSASRPDRNIVRFLDIDPVQGVNQYRVRIHLQNNQELVTDTIQTYFLTKTPFIVFPNPLPVGTDINVYAGKFETINFQFELFNSNGAFVRSAQLLSDREFISTAGLPPGLYIYKIRGQTVDVSGKIVIR